MNCCTYDHWIKCACYNYKAKNRTEQKIASLRKLKNVQTWKFTKVFSHGGLDFKSKVHLKSSAQSVCSRDVFSQWDVTWWASMRSLQIHSKYTHKCNSTVDITWPLLHTRLTVHEAYILELFIQTIWLSSQYIMKKWELCSIIKNPWFLDPKEIL